MPLLIRLQEEVRSTFDWLLDVSFDDELQANAAQNRTIARHTSAAPEQLARKASIAVPGPTLELLMAGRRHAPEHAHADADAHADAPAATAEAGGGDEDAQIAGAADEQPGAGAGAPAAAPAAGGAHANAAHGEDELSSRSTGEQGAGLRISSSRPAEQSEAHGGDADQRGDADSDMIHPRLAGPVADMSGGGEGGGEAQPAPLPEEAAGGDEAAAAEGQPTGSPIGVASLEQPAHTQQGGADGEGDGPVPARQTTDDTAGSG